MLQPATLKFLKDLKKNNNKPWFEQHRAVYEAAKKDFEQVVDAVIKSMEEKDPHLAGIQAKQATFRINRDVRFSKDKSPYKTNMGASMKRGGKKSVFAGYYFHCEPGKSFSGGGIWMPDPASTKKIRQEIAYSHHEFEKILKDKKFKSTFASLDNDEEYKLSKVPKGYEKDDPAAEYLKFKSWIATREITDEEITSKSLVKVIVNSFVALQPLVEFINRSLED